jgi:hypothetical protein
MSKGKNFFLGGLAGFGVSLILVLIVWSALLHSQREPSVGAPILQGDIAIEPTRPLSSPDKIQPGSEVKLKLKVENIGQNTSAAGQIYIRYALVKPLNNQPESIIFQTEAVDLPTIPPGEQIEISFATPHKWPSIFDFVRYDWPMREYQAIVKINGVERLIGTLAVTVSAYYYPGIKKEHPQEVLPSFEPALQK